VANVVRVFTKQIKHIIHDILFNSLFGVSENTMWNSSEVMHFLFTWN